MRSTCKLSAIDRFPLLRSPSVLLRIIACSCNIESVSHAIRLALSDLLWSSIERLLGHREPSLRLGIKKAPYRGARRCVCRL